MKRPLFLFLFLFAVVSSQAQQICIGKLLGDSVRIVQSSSDLQKAIEWTLHDGTKLDTVLIQKMHQTYFLVAKGKLNSKPKLVSITLVQENVQLIATPTAMLQTCSASACPECRFFFENGKIVACKCDETGTVSNHCHFKNTSAASFILNLQRILARQQQH